MVKIGGPAYRIGMGGGAASSIASGSNKADLDFNAVQVCSTEHAVYGGLAGWGLYRAAGTGAEMRPLWLCPRGWTQQYA